MTKKVVVDCTTGDQMYVDLTAEEEQELAQGAVQAEQEQTRAQIAQHEDEFERQEAVKNLLLSPAVAADPALAQALSYILGV